MFASAAFGPLSEVSAAGGTPVQLTSVERADITHRNPHFLPDGKRLLFFRGGSSTRAEKTDGIYSLDLETKKVEQISNEQSEGIYVEPGYLIFVRDGNLMAQPIDADRLRTTGQAVPIAEKVFFNPLRLTGLYFFDLDTNRETRITRDGSETLLNGTLSWVYWEEVFGRRDIGYWWAPDSQAIAYLQSDDSQVDLSYFVDIAPF